MTLILEKLQALKYLAKFIPTTKVSRGFKLLSDLRGAMAELTGLAHIDVRENDPYVLFKDWQQEARIFSTGMPGALCLATVSREGKVSARHVILRRLDEDGFVLLTDRRGQKAKDLREVPSAAMCFLWAYSNDKGEAVARQVRIEGIVAELKKEDFQELYDREPLYCKIRSHICHQTSKVDWEELKTSHDQLLQKFERGETDLPMPDHYVGYKLAPSSVEFYYARDNLIADRVLFEKNPNSGDWIHHHLAA